MIKIIFPYFYIRESQKLNFKMPVKPLKNLIAVVTGSSYEPEKE